ncbi:hypothetical protein BDZ91DRAFT_710751 [Kalaharituber pfeilii]|nr:hypothetical protein BDZ91DRAFT_710751 [Kalaharituber pfeilii]
MEAFITCTISQATHNSTLGNWATTTAKTSESATVDTITSTSRTPKGSCSSFCSLD